MNQTPNATVLRVAVPVPLRRLFDYRPPEGSDPRQIHPGARLRLPFGRRELTGVLVEIADSSAFAGEQLKPATAVLDETALLTRTMIALCQWAADYYQHPIGEVFSAALPRALRDGRDLPKSCWQLTVQGQGLAEGALRRAPSQARAIALLQTRVREQTALREAGVSTAVLRELVAKGLIERCTALTTTPDSALREEGPALGAEQREVLDAIPREHFGCHLLQGITGSGKTEVYLQLIADCLRHGRQALVLVPEIGLTPQTVARFEARFRAPVAVLHSGLGDGQRLAAWQAARSGSAGVVIGTRSAVFTPMANIGLIVVDEEHDGSFKQQDGFRYSARDVAIKRAQLEDCPVLLGSATPSLESIANAGRGRYSLHQLRERRGGGELPRLRTIDLRGLPLSAGISERLLEAVRETVEKRGQQALLFLNRRGFAPTLQCHHCGWIAGCDHCDARLTVHLRKRCLRCHHCAARRPLPAQCPDCGSGSLLTHGLGTEQVEEFLHEAVNAPVHRVDSDAMRGPEAMQTFLDIAQGAEPCVILGTQMLTKGHHFPAVQLVGIIDADALLYSADFRGEERMAQLVTQVAGRAGRERAGGQVLVQTHYPADPLFELLRDGDFTAIAEALLQRRQASGLPPFGHLCLLRTDARNEADGERFLQTLARQARARLPADCRLIGPLPSAMPRRAGRFRWQLWCLATQRGSAQQAARMLVSLGEEARQSPGLNWFIDVDPADVL